MKAIAFLAICTVFCSAAFAQKKTTPQAVTDSFAKRYPSATNVTYKDMLTYVSVQFVEDSAKMTARFNNKGEWKGTTRAFDFEQLVPEVKDGFRKSKYADEWKVTETAIVNEPGTIEQYRLKVEKNDLQKKYLYFNKSGRLLRDAITL